ncbi:MAG: alanine racemase [Desulfitobacteriaceae bacterium]
MIDYQRLENNLSEMVDLARRAGVALRPHVKSHKLPPLANLQMAYGAVGITVAKLGEAEVMAEHGIQDVFIANQIIGEEKWSRLFALADKIRLAVGVDSQEGVRDLALAAERLWGQGHPRILDVLIEIDSGLHRCGIEPGPELIQLAREVKSFNALHLRGIFTHAGHAYGARDRMELERIGREEGEIVARAAEELRRMGIPIEVVSVGSTPTVGLSAFVSGVTEIRPGNYVFYDAMQLTLGVIPDVERCALRVFSTVISHPSPQRWVIDAGSKTLALDQGAHGHAGVQGYGLIHGRPRLKIVRLSEEHGIVEGNDSTLRIGDVLEVIPNHACTVMNLFDQVDVRNRNGIEIWTIAARGKNR